MIIISIGKFISEKYPWINIILIVKYYFFIGLIIIILYFFFSLYLLYYFHTHKNALIPAILPNFIFNWFKGNAILSQNPELFNIVKTDYYNNLLFYTILIIILIINVYFKLI